MDDQLKQQVLISAFAFSATVIVYVIYRTMTRADAWNAGATFGMYLIAIVLGAVVGGVAFAITLFLKK